MKTAVTRLITYLGDSNNKPLTNSEIRFFIKLEREQILNAFKDGITSANYSTVAIDDMEANAEEYYTQTFKTNNDD